MTKTISAAVNPALANNLIQQAMAETKPEQSEVKIIPPSDNVVTLPGGYINAAGEVITEAEVRELTGADEEAIAKASDVGRALLIILQRGTVRIGEEKATEKILDQLLSGDRDTLLLAIFKATFGHSTEVPVFFGNELKQVEVDLDKEIKFKVLVDSINDRVFTVKGRKHEYTVQLPTGVAQKEMILNSDKTSAELTTIMLENTVMQIDGSPVLTKQQVRNLGLVDRKAIVDEINSRIPGPQFDDITVEDPDTGKEVLVPVNFGTLFRF
jgi:hypothetical protein